MDLSTKIKKEYITYIPEENFLKKKKKFKSIKAFNTTFLSTKKVTIFKKLQSYFNESKLIWHYYLRQYLPKIKNNLIKYNRKVGHKMFFLFLEKLELRLSVILLRSRFFYKLSNSYNAVKLNLILVNGIIIKNTNYLIEPLDLFQKRRKCFNKVLFNLKHKRFLRLKWRNYRWKKARFFFWKIRKNSEFNLFLSRKENSVINYLELNYKIPAGVLLRRPNLNEIILKSDFDSLSSDLLRKIYYIF